MDLINSSAPGVYSFTRVQAQAVSESASTVVGVVFESEKGPVDEPVLITGGSRERFIQLFGPPRPGISSAHECALEVLKANASVLALRVANESNYAGISIFSSSDYNEGVVNTDSESFFPQQVFFEPTGTVNGVLADDGSNVTILEIKGVKTDGGTDLVMNVSFVVGGGEPDVDVGVDYNTSFAQTVQDFITELQGALDDAEFGATVSLLNTNTTGHAFIAVRSVPGEDLPAFYDLENTLTVSDTTFTKIHSQSKFFDVYAISPGVWGNRVGIRVRNVDYGRQAVTAIEFDSFVNGTGYTFTIDGETYGPYGSVGTGSIAILDEIVDALAADLEPYNISVKVGSQSWATALSATPETAAASDDTIYIRHRDFGAELAVSVVSDDEDVTVTVEKIVDPEPYSGLFTLEVFLRDDPTAPVETFRVTLHENVNDFGEQTNISYVVNEGPAASAYIRVRQPAYTLYSEIDNSHLMRMLGYWTDDSRTTYHVNSSIEYLGGGDAGNAVTTADYLAGLEKFRDRDRYYVSLLMNAGVTNRDVQKKMLEICEARRDCFAVLDMPSALQEVSRAKEYVDYELGVDTSVGGIYTPDIRVVSEYSPGGRFLPPSGDVCARIANRQQAISNLGAPAGLEVGSILRMNKARVDYSQSDIGALQESRINPIVRKLNRGFAIWGARTLARKFGPLSFTSIRLDLNQIESQMVQILDYAVFRANSVPNRFGLKQQIDALLTSYRRAGVIDYHEVTIDEKNNKDYHAANGQMNIDAIMRFVYPAEKIKLVTTVTDTIITFNELQAAS